jgi:hypothetical protein
MFVLDYNRPWNDEALHGDVEGDETVKQVVLMEFAVSFGTGISLRIRILVTRIFDEPGGNWI